MKIRLGGEPLKNSLANGEGMRYVIFVSGCTHRCPGCHNEELQDFNYGVEYDVRELIEDIRSNMPIIKGVTFSGGDPMDNADKLLELACAIKHELGLNLWCYTGYTLEELHSANNVDQIHLLKYIDTLVDGPFIKELTEGASKYTGSNNQKIITFKR